MAHNPDRSKQIAAYIDLGLHRRMDRVAKKNLRYSISRQVEYALEAHIASLESKVGLKARS